MQRIAVTITPRTPVAECSPRHSVSYLCLQSVVLKSSNSLNLSQDVPNRSLHMWRRKGKDLFTKHRFSLPYSLLSTTNTCQMSTSQQPPDERNSNIEKLLSYTRRQQFESFSPIILPRSATQQGNTTNSPATNKDVEDWNDVLNRWYQNYQDFIGITDMKKAQTRVTELSEILLGTQSRRRELQADIEKLQESLIANNQQITKTELYSDAHYALFDQAREMNNRMKSLRAEFEYSEQLERDTFTQLSAAIRDCHERERFQAEQSKYWSIIASVVSAALASVFTSVNNWVRIREVKEHVSQNSQELMEGYHKMLDNVVASISQLHVQNDVISLKPADAQNSSPLLLTPAETNLATPPHEAGSVANMEIPKEIGNVEDSDAPKEIGIVEDSDAPKEIGNVEDSDAPKEPAVADILMEDILAIKESLDDTQNNVTLLNKSVESLKEEISSATKIAEENLTGHVAALLTEERKLLYQEMNAQLEEVLRKFLLATEKYISDQIEPEEPSEASPLAWDDDDAKSEVVIVDYSYRRIATAMVVGAGIGTLVTAFMLGSFPDSG